MCCILCACESSCSPLTVPKLMKASVQTLRLATTAVGDAQLRWSTHPGFIHIQGPTVQLGLRIYSLYFRHAGVSIKRPYPYSAKPILLTSTTSTPLRTFDGLSCLSAWIRSACSTSRITLNPGREMLPPMTRTPGLQLATRSLDWMVWRN